MQASTSGADPAGVAVRHIVIVGLMGSGKTSVGQLIGESLGWPLRDSDRDIEAARGLTVREIADADGVDAMHRLEAGHLLAALADARPSVVCAAASVVDDAPCRQALRSPDVAVVWLRASPAVVARRFAEGAHRPSYGDDPEAFLAAQAARRYPQFGAVATVILDTDEATPAATAGAAVAALIARGALPKHEG